MGFQRIVMTQPKTVAYLRVSTTDQDLEKGRVAILSLANEKDLGRVHWVEEIVSGKVSWKRRKIAQVIEELGEGDNLLTSELSRLGRSMLECMEILSVASEKGQSPYEVLLALGRGKVVSSSLTVQI